MLVGGRRRIGERRNEQLQDVDIADARCGGKIIGKRAGPESAVGAGGKGGGEGSEAESGGRGEGLEARHIEVERRDCMSNVAVGRLMETSKYSSV